MILFYKTNKQKQRVSGRREEKSKGIVIFNFYSLNIINRNCIYVIIVYVKQHRPDGKNLSIQLKR